MPIFEQGYRRFDGELSPRSRVLPIAMENVRTRVRWWTWVILVVAVFFPHVLYGVMIFVMTLGQAAMGVTPKPIGAAPMVAFDSQFRPDRVMTLISGDATYLFWDAMQLSWFWALLFPAVACAGILASDRRTGALQIYFARPVTRRDYLAAKFLATTAFTAAVTGVPALFLWLEAALLNADGMYVVNTWHAPLAILASTGIYCIWNGSVVLFLSSILKRPLLVAIAALVLVLSLFAIGTIMSEALDDKTFQILRPNNLLGGLSAPFFGLQLPPHMQTPWLLVAGLGVPVVLLSAVWYRTKAIEVHT